ncbi:hypothetical protein GOP47_0029533, partial [Adiantum capillus-veneris]
RPEQRMRFPIQAIANCGADSFCAQPHNGLLVHFLKPVQSQQKGISQEQAQMLNMRNTGRELRSNKLQAGLHLASIYNAGICSHSAQQNSGWSPTVKSTSRRSMICGTPNPSRSMMASSKARSSCFPCSSPKDTGGESLKPIQPSPHRPSSSTRCLASATESPCRKWVNYLEL